MGLAMVLGDVAGVMHAKLEFVPSQDWDISSFNLLRHPLVIGGIGMLFMWHVSFT